MIPEPFIITKKKKESKDTFTFELFSESLKNFVFKPGQFNMLYLFGIGEVPVSISGHPENTEKLIHTIRNVGIVTNGMSKLKKGDVIGVRGPFGSEWPVETAKGKDVIIVAGGLGLAPLRPAIYQILSNRELYEKVIILYGAREPENIIFEKEIHKWRSSFDIDVRVTVDHAINVWHGEVGVITSLIKKSSFNVDNSISMVCGPELMMRFSAIELENKGVNSKNIFISMERNMKCAIGFCGHCQYGPKFICKDGAVFCYEELKYLLNKREV